VNNADRKGGHCLLGEDGRIWAIDHGVCFHEEPKLRTVIWEFMDEPIPPALAEAIGGFGAALGARQPVRERLTGLLSDREIEALAERARSIADDPVFPTPSEGRPYPWPPV
jgi:uncharacterized repeat protein (TIGR03843 family)